MGKVKKNIHDSFDQLGEKVELNVMNLVHILDGMVSETSTILFQLRSVPSRSRKLKPNFLRKLKQISWKKMLNLPRRILTSL